MNIFDIDTKIKPHDLVINMPADNSTHLGLLNRLK